MSLQRAPARRGRRAYTDFELLMLSTAFAFCIWFGAGLLLAALYGRC